MMLTSREWSHRTRDAGSIFYRFFIPTLQVLIFCAAFWGCAREVREGQVRPRGGDINGNPVRVQKH